MKTYRVEIAVSYDVEAEDSLEAEEKAYELLEKDIGKAAADAVLKAFGVTTMEIEP